MNRFIYCIKVKQEVGYCEFVYAVSAIFAHALVGVFYRLFTARAMLALQALY